MLQRGTFISGVLTLIWSVNTTITIVVSIQYIYYIETIYNYNNIVTRSGERNSYSRIKMKLLVVFLSALVLVAHANVASSEEVSGYAAVAGQDAGDGEPQGVFPEEVESRVGSLQEPEDGK